MSKKRTVPVQDLGIKSIPTPDEVFESFQTKGRYPKDNSHSDVDDTPSSNSSSEAYAMPVHESQQHGPVKVYTQEEIKEYTEQRDMLEELDDGED